MRAPNWNFTELLQFELNYKLIRKQKQFMHQKLTNNLLVKCKGLFFMLLILGFSAGVKAQDGKALFDANCKSCHAMNDVVIGPALKDVQKNSVQNGYING